MKKSICTIVSIEYSKYLYWQSEVLWNSFKESKQDGDFICLIATNNKERIHKITSPYYLTKNYKNINNDKYCAYNKPASIIEFIESRKITSENVLIIDPDCFFVSPVQDRVEKGEIISNYYNYLDIDVKTGWNKTEELIKRHLPINCQNKYKPCGIPNIVHTSNLEELCKLWLKYTIDIRSDENSKIMADWIAEMYGYNFAVAHLGFSHKIKNTSNRSFESNIDKPIVHYTDIITNFEMNFSWSKRNYIPWSFPGKAPPRSNKMLIEMLKQIENVAKKYSFEIIGDDFDQSDNSNFLNVNAIQNARPAHP